MRRIIITAILTVICAVGAGTSFAVNDLPNFGEWMKTNEQQFRKPPKHDGPNKHMDKHMDKDINKHMDKHMMDGKGQDGQGAPQGQVPQLNGQVSPQGQPPQQQNGNAPQQQNGNAPQPPMGQGASQSTQN